LLLPFNSFQDIVKWPIVSALGMPIGEINLRVVIVGTPNVSADGIPTGTIAPTTGTPNACALGMPVGLMNASANHPAISLP
jgi:hypothetical protein